MYLRYSSQFSCGCTAPGGIRISAFDYDDWIPRGRSPSLEKPLGVMLGSATWFHRQMDWEGRSGWEKNTRIMKSQMSYTCWEEWFLDGYTYTRCKRGGIFYKCFKTLNCRESGTRR